MRDPHELLVLLRPDVLVNLAREHLSGVADLHVDPDIPPRKLRGAREVHALHLPPDEPIVLLCDSTLFGGGDVGFVATPARLCWKNWLDHPRSARWDELARMELAVHENVVRLARGRLESAPTPRVAELVRDFLEACCRRTIASSAPYRDAARDSGPATFAELVVSSARRALGEVDWVHYAPSIPPKMKHAARAALGEHLAPDEAILVLYDETLLGSGSDGFVLTERGVRWRNLWSRPDALAWTELSPERAAIDRDQLFFDGAPTGDDARRIDLRMHPGMAEHVLAALGEIARAARAGRETAPPG
jgi:hypothetical protein